MKLYPLLTGCMNAKRITLVKDEKALKNPDYRQIVPLPAYLIEHPSLGYILFDSGCDPHGMEVWTPSRAATAPLINPEHKFILENLQEIGVNPDDVHLFVMSHLHIDHAGGLYLFKNVKKAYVSQKEYEQQFIIIKITFH